MEHEMRLVVIHTKQNGYSIYDGRRCVAGFVAQAPLTAKAIELLRVAHESELKSK